MALPAWAPSTEQVANYIPGRAISTTGVAQDDFGDTTRPTSGQVENLIADACTWVAVKTGTVDTDLEDMAAACAAVYAAAQVERGMPDRSADVNTAQQLYQQAVAMRDDLDSANKALTGVDETDPQAQVPLYAFPSAPTWADLDL